MRWWLIEHLSLKSPGTVFLFAFAFSPPSLALFFLFAFELLNLKKKNLMMVRRWWSEVTQEGQKESKKAKESSNPSYMPLQQDTFV